MEKANITLNAWKNYFSQHQLDSQLDPIIALSWERCRYKKLDPYDSLDNIVVLEDKEFEDRRLRRMDLLKHAKPFIQTLYHIVKDSGFMVILADEQGLVLEMLGDPQIIKNTSRLNFKPGSVWSEDIRGTNAIGTAIVERRSVQVYATEHYCKSLHHLTCSATPIFDNEGIMIGVLDVTGPYHYAHPHTLGMVISTVEAIKMQMANHLAKDNLASAYLELTTIMDSINEGLISVNRHGVIKQINTWAAKLLDTDPKQCIGKSILDLFGDNNPIEQVLKDEKGFEHKEMSVNLSVGRVHLSCSTKIYKDRKGRPGVIVTIWKQKQIHSLVNKIAGNQARFSFNDVVGSSSELEKSIILAKKVAKNDSTVLIQGESGTGKEVFAQAIHSDSYRKNEPFVAINCAAIPRALVESELFGYDDGAFTGGRKGGHAGKLELANGGTIFLDEIGDMPLEIQGSLLRFLQEKQIIRVGGFKPIYLNVRVIAATNKDLSKEVDKGNFRLDLYYRLNVVSLKLPSLKERKEDIIPLTESFLRQMSKQMGKNEPVISEEATLLLQNYDWPGNIRELENTIENVMNLIEGQVLTVAHLPEKLRTIIFSGKQISSTGVLREYEDKAIKQAIQLCQGNLTKSAQYLGIGRATLYRKIKKLGIVN